MILTPRMWNVQKRIDFLERLRLGNSGDYMITFELEELRILYSKLVRIEKLGLRLVKGGKHPSNSYTPLQAHGS